MDALFALKLAAVVAAVGWACWVAGERWQAHRALKADMDAREAWANDYIKRHHKGEAA